MKRKKQQGKKFNWKALLICFIFVALASGTGMAFFYAQRDPQIIDDTEIKQMADPLDGVDKTGDGQDDKDDQGNGKPSDGGSDDNKVEAVLSQNVKVFAAEDAQAVHDAIQSVQVTQSGLRIEMAAGSLMDNIGVGDIFFLEHTDQAMLDETYIGKIASVTSSGGQVTYYTENPMADEVFDVLEIDYSQVMTAENVSEIQTLPGVSVRTVDDLASYFQDEPGFADRKESLSPELLYTNHWDAEQDHGGFLIDFEIDLAKDFSFFKKDTDFTEKTNNKDTVVYIAQTGNCYHRVECFCLAKGKNPTDLSDALSKGYRACRLCQPAISTDSRDKFGIEPELKLKGKIGFEKMGFDIDYEWDILNGKGLENLSINVAANNLATVEFNAGLSMEFQGKRTAMKLPLESDFVAAEVQGLREKMFPLAFVGFNGAFTPVISGNEQIKAMTAAVPLTIGVMIYVDINGNVTTSARAYMTYKQQFSYKNVVVRDGKWILDQEVDCTPYIEAGLEAEARGDLDAHLGVSACCYIFNINIVELAVEKIGIEAEGFYKLACFANSLGDKSVDTSGAFYLRCYNKLFELNVRLKAKFKLGSLIDFDKGFDFSEVLWREDTLFECGMKNSTYHDPGTMSFTAITAKDPEAVYYKNTEGYLVREVDGYKTVIYDGGFFSICGIDDSYIYLQQKNDDGKYDIYRVLKENGNSYKRVLESIRGCLTMDDKYIYYIPEFDEKSIERLDRESLKESSFAAFDEQVKFMRMQGENFYVVTEGEVGFMMAILGPPDRYCYLINADGNIVADFGSNVSVENYFMSDLSRYFSASRMLSDGYLRGTAEETYWMSADKSTSVKAEGISGWKPQNAGIFTTLENDSDSAAAPYKIVLYQAGNGQQVTVTDVYNEHAFFTLCQSMTGAWYFFDQTETELILYTMREDFSNKTIIKTFSLGEISYNLSECSMVIMDDRLYFYTMPDDATSIVLYCYDLI